MRLSKIIVHMKFFNLCVHVYERERERERERDRDRDRERDTERERQRQRDRGRPEKDGETWHGSERKKSLHVAIVCLWVRLPNTWSFDVQWVFFVFERHWPTSVCSCEQLVKQEAENKNKIKKLKEKRRKLSWNVAVVTRKRGAGNYFIWGLSGEDLSKLNILSQSKAQCWFRKRKTELKIIEKTKICIPAMLKPYSASSFCLPNKNRVGVAHGDGTNLEVVHRIHYTGRFGWDVTTCDFCSQKALPSQAQIRLCRFFFFFFFFKSETHVNRLCWRNIYNFRKSSMGRWSEKRPPIVLLHQSHRSPQRSRAVQTIPRQDPRWFSCGLSWLVVPLRPLHCQSLSAVRLYVIKGENRRRRCAGNSYRPFA